ncbi:hypothetical protein L195_g061652, partial [Trifolium pratense]
NSFCVSNNHFLRFPLIVAAAARAAFGISTHGIVQNDLRWRGPEETRVAPRRCGGWKKRN